MQSILKFAALRPDCICKCSCDNQSSEVRNEDKEELETSLRPWQWDELDVHSEAQATFVDGPSDMQYSPTTIDVDSYCHPHSFGNPTASGFGDLIPDEAPEESPDSSVFRRNAPSKTFEDFEHTFPDGRFYRGQWLNNQMHGRGFLRFTDGREYVGYFADGRRHGEGDFFWPSGAKYQGQWKGGKGHGFGVLRRPDGQIRHGEWRDGNILRWFGDDMSSPRQVNLPSPRFR